MRTIEELANVQGGPAEVYSRIVGYYRSARNWNKGKKEEYDERKLFEVSESRIAAATASVAAEAGENAMARTIEREASIPIAEARAEAQGAADAADASHNSRLLLFVRPACPSAKTAASRLGIPVDMVSADTEDRLAEAIRRKVLHKTLRIKESP
ncbi:MAG: anaerobic ribonucleoside-triphosphate reductase [Treponema sp.]|jgi:ribonucleoside-triphosphate reductase|nr:anaerobic ribonucleoside-triphosphate reductase [Treponema sp.]